MSFFPIAFTWNPLSDRLSLPGPIRLSAVGLIFLSFCLFFELSWEIGFSLPDRASLFGREGGLYLLWKAFDIVVVIYLDGFPRLVCAHESMILFLLHSH